MTGNNAVVQFVDLAVFQITEHISQIDDSADEKPYRSNHRHDAWNAQRPDEIIIAPPAFRPGMEEIPDHDAEEDAEAQSERIKEHAPGYDLVPAGIFGSDADDAAENIFEAPGHLVLDISIRIVNAAMQHAVQIEWPFAGEPRDNAVAENTEYHGDEAELDLIDGTSVRSDPPDHIRIQRGGKILHDPVRGGGPVHFLQPGIDRTSPIPLDKDACQHHAAAGK